MAQFFIVDEGWSLDGLIDLGTFELLDQIARTGSLTAAATAMGITQQAASARIGRLERRLSRQLLRRGAAGSDLTADGAVVLAWAVPVLDAAHRAAVSLDSMRRNDAVLTVFASQTIAEHLLPGWLQRLRANTPDAAVRLSSGNSEDVIGSVRDGSAALGFIETPTMPAGLHTALVGRDELALVVEPGHSWVGQRITAETLAMTPLLSREAGSGTRATLEAWLSDRGLTLSVPAAELRTSSAIRAAVMAGVGPAVLSARAVSDDVASGRLARVEFADRAPERPLTALWRNAEPSAPARALVAIALSME